MIHLTSAIRTAEGRPTTVQEHGMYDLLGLLGVELGWLESDEIKPVKP